jgi:hypothetical protein
MLWAAGAGVALVSTVALASVTLDVNDGALTGFIGKGDIQSAFHYNNKQMQDQVNNVKFTFGDSLHVTFSCTFETTHTTHTHDWDRSGDLSVTWIGNPRLNPTGSGTGWLVSGTLHLTGNLASLTEFPVEGQPCPIGNGTVDVGSINVIESGAALTATIGGNVQNIPITSLTGTLF